MKSIDKHLAINWKCSPHGTVGVAKRKQELAFIDKNGYIFLDGYWGISTGWKIVALHPALKNEAETLKDKQSQKKQDSPHFKATRKNLEQIANDAQSRLTTDDTQNVEQWTHTTNSGYLCKILVTDPDVNGYIIVLTSDGEYMRHAASSLKPIKPAITKEQHEFLCKFSVDVNNVEVVAEVESYLAKHDIVEVKA